MFDGKFPKINYYAPWPVHLVTENILMISGANVKNCPSTTCFSFLPWAVNSPL